jgi:hypothetical protein
MRESSERPKGKEELSEIKTIDENLAAFATYSQKGTCGAQ